MLGPDRLTIRSIGMSVVRSGPGAVVLHLGHRLETGKAANKYCDTALHHAPQCKPRDLGVDALGIRDDDASNSDTDDEYTKAHHGKQAELLLKGYFDAYDD